MSERSLLRLAQDRSYIYDIINIHNYHKFILALSKNDLGDGAEALRINQDSLFSNGFSVQLSVLSGFNFFTWRPQRALCLQCKF